MHPSCFLPALLAFSAPHLAPRPSPHRRSSLPHLQDAANQQPFIQPPRVAAAASRAAQEAQIALMLARMRELESRVIELEEEKSRGPFRRLGGAIGGHIRTTTTRLTGQRPLPGLRRLRLLANPAEVVAPHWGRPCPPLPGSLP